MSTLNVKALSHPDLTANSIIIRSDSNVNVSSNVAIAGSETVGGTLGVTGAATLSSTLGVTGAATLSSTAAVTGATTFSNTISVTGTSTFSNTSASGTTTVTRVKETVKTNTGDTYTIDLSAGTLFNLTSANGCTVTVPGATGANSGASFTIIAATASSWSGTIYWSGGAAPSGTGPAIYSFVSNGTNWYGMEAGSSFASV